MDNADFSSGDAPPHDVLILCRLHGGRTPNGVIGAVRAMNADGVAIELAVRLAPDALPALAHVAAPDPSLPDLILTLRGAADDVGRAVGGIVSAAGACLDHAGSAVLAARRHAILPGGDAIRLFFGLRRLPALTLDGFHDYWLHRHAAIGRRLIPPYTYHQLHADPVATAMAAERAGLAQSTLDGVVEVHFPDVAALVAQLSRPEVAEEALADERNFIDHARSIFWVYETR